MVVVGSIVYLKHPDGRVLLQTRKSGRMKGYIGLPGGKVEEGEGTVQAGIRELEEETGLIAKHADLLGCYSEVSYAGRGLSGHYVLFVLGVRSYTGRLVSETAEGSNFFFEESRVSSLGRVLPDLYFVLDRVRNPPFVDHLTRYIEGDREYVLTQNGDRYPKSY